MWVHLTLADEGPAILSYRPVRNCLHAGSSTDLLEASVAFGVLEHLRERIEGNSAFRA